MPCDFRRFAVLLMLLFVHLPAGAQEAGSVPLAVGSGTGRIGLVAVPNEECHGPATVTPTGDGRLAVLDPVNRKIVLVGQSTPQDVPLPGDLVEPTDLVATTRGYVVVGALGQVALIDGSGTVLERKSGRHNPETGAVRLATSAAGELAIEDIQGIRTPLGLDPLVVGRLAVPGLAAAGSYARTSGAADRIVMTTGAISGPLSTVTLTSRMRIIDARALWVAEGQGALFAVQESRLLPEEAVFVRLVSVDSTGRPTSEAYIGPEAFSCGTRRPFARLADGRVASLAFGDRETLALNYLAFVPTGTATPKSLGRRSDAVLISEDSDTLSELETLNGTPSISTISLSPITRKLILERARAALDLPWTLAPANFGHPNVPNECAPLSKIWRRPTRLNSLLERSTTRIPYRWGGYLPTLATFEAHLKEGRLAGDDCTCRKGNCVHPQATGMDCSGFVSFAWRTGNYFTTASLPRSNISTPVEWRDLAPGDIVNKARSHVRLVESIADGPGGRIVTVIESATKESCGGVCRRAYTQSGDCPEFRVRAGG